jgi:nucleobase:cation symporter-1, NCS1 family
MLSTPSKFRTFAEFFHFFIPSLTGVVGFWATVALNIPDFTRFAKTQRAQIVGQALALPTTMTFYSFVGVAVTSATVIIFGQAIWDPVVVLSKLGNPLAVVIAMIALLMASYGNFIFGWLVGYSGFLGPIAGVLVADYFVVHKKVIQVDDLYRRGGAYEFTGGFNFRAIAALAAGIAVALVGLVVPQLRVLYDYAWFIGFGVSFVVHCALARVAGDI